MLQMHPDLPNSWDAWDIDRHYLHRHVDVTQCDSLAVVEAGPLVGAIRVDAVLRLLYGHANRATDSRKPPYRT